MQLRVSTTCLLVLSAANLIAAADNPFVGTWKLDPSKSDLTGETVKLESAGSDKLQYSSGGQSYTFTTDGKKHPGFFGRVVSVKEVDYLGENHYLQRQSAKSRYADAFIRWKHVDSDRERH
jgi:hypothetical protein